MSPSDRHTRSPYAPGLARRKAILDAAVDLLGEVGYHSTPLRGIIRSVGIPHPGVVYHLPSKGILLMSVAGHHEKEMGFDFRKLVQLDAMALFDTSLEALPNMVTNAIVVEAEYMLLTEASSKLHPAHDHYRKRNREFRILLTQAQAELQAQELTHTTLKTRDVAVLQMSLLGGVLNQRLYTHKRSCPGRVAQFYLSMFTPGATQESPGRYREAGWLC